MWPWVMEVMWVCHTFARRCTWISYQEILFPNFLKYNFFMYSIIFKYYWFHRLFFNPGLISIDLLCSGPNGPSVSNFINWNCFDYLFLNYIKVIISSPFSRKYWPSNQNCYTGLSIFHPKRFRKINVKK